MQAVDSLICFQCIVVCSLLDLGCAGGWALLLGAIEWPQKVFVSTVVSSGNQGNAAKYVPSWIPGCSEPPASLEGFHNGGSIVVTLVATTYSMCGIASCCRGTYDKVEWFRVMLIVACILRRSHGQSDLSGNGNRKRAGREILKQEQKH
jgi:hypothetical protein